MKQEEIEKVIGKLQKQTTILTEAQISFGDKGFLCKNMDRSENPKNILSQSIVHLSATLEIIKMQKDAMIDQDMYERADQLDFLIQEIEALAAAYYIALSNLENVQVVKEYNPVLINYGQNKAQT